MRPGLIRPGLAKPFIAMAILGSLVILVACAGTAAPTPTSAGVAPTAMATGTSATPASSAVPSSVSPAATSQVVPGGDPSAAPAAIAKYGCGNCHTIPGIAGANGKVGPAWAGFANRPKIAGTVPKTPDNVVKWIENPQSLKPGTAMPTLGVTPTDARNIAAFLYTLK